MKGILALRPVIGTTYRIAPVKSSPNESVLADERTLRQVLTDFPANFNVRETLADRMTSQKRFEEAAQLRFDGCILVADLLEETDEEVELDWDDEYTALTMGMVYASALDHFVAGDYEVAAAMLELLVDYDPEDHLNASELLAFCYVALEEWELFDEVLEVLSADALSTQLVKYWGEYRKSGDKTVKNRMKKEASALYKEWTAPEHEEQGETESETRKLWLRTETLWLQFPDFIEALK